MKISLTARLARSLLQCSFALLFPLLVLPLGWVLRRLFDPLRLARPGPGTTSHFVFVKSPSILKGVAHGQTPADAR